MEVLGTAALASFFTLTGHIQSMNKVEKERQAAARQEKKKRRWSNPTLHTRTKPSQERIFLIKVKLRTLCNTLFL